MAGRQALEPNFQGVNEQAFPKPAGSGDKQMAVEKSGRVLRGAHGTARIQQSPEVVGFVHIELLLPANVGKRCLAGVQGRVGKHGRAGQRLVG